MNGWLWRTVEKLTKQMTLTNPLRLVKVLDTDAPDITEELEGNWLATEDDQLEVDPEVVRVEEATATCCTSDCCEDWLEDCDAKMTTELGEEDTRDEARLEDAWLDAEFPGEALAGDELGTRDDTGETGLQSPKLAWHPTPQ